MKEDEDNTTKLSVRECKEKCIFLNQKHMNNENNDNYIRYGVSHISNIEDLILFGTGFFISVNNNFIFITCKHVFEDIFKRYDKCYVTVRVKKLDTDKDKIKRLIINPNDIYIHKDDNIDIAYIESETLIKKLNKNEKLVIYYFSIHEHDFNTFNNVAMLGYPWGKKSNNENMDLELPIMRYGYLSVPLSSVNKGEEPLINISGFNCDSGSPVFLIEEKIKNLSISPKSSFTKNFQIVTFNLIGLYESGYINNEDYSLSGNTPIDLLPKNQESLHLSRYIRLSNTLFYSNDYIIFELNKIKCIVETCENKAPNNCSICNDIYCDNHSRKCNHCNNVFCINCDEKNIFKCDKCECFICFDCSKKYIKKLCKECVIEYLLDNSIKDFF